MKVLLTGSSGLLGSEILRLLRNKHEVHVLAIYNTRKPMFTADNIEFVKLDIQKTLFLEDLIIKYRPDTIVHAAAYTDVDGCEVNRERAWKTNVEATRSIVRAARITRSHIIYVSTDYVFDGEKGMYNEKDIPYPINYYGLTKLLAEEHVRNSDLLYTIIRTSAIYGIGGSKKSFAEYVIEKLSNNENIYALKDQYVSPTYNKHLAQAITEIIDLKPLGIYHIAGPRMSRYEFAIKIAETFGYNKDLVIPATMKDMKKWRAKRPRDSSLDCSKASNILSTKFNDIDQALNDIKKIISEK